MLNIRHELQKQSRTLGITRSPVAAIILLLLVSVLVLLLGKHDEIKKPDLVFADLQNQKWNSFQSLVQMNALVDFRSGTDLVWQIPNSPKAVLFLAHGCGGTATNFWDKSPNCPNCIGLPEERLIVLHALARKFAVIAISSHGDCWSSGEEKSVVDEILKWWITKQKLESLPVFAMGASSGGYFVSALAVEFPFMAIALMISEGLYSHLDISKNYPSTIFVHMPKDEARKRMINRNVARMRDIGIDVDEIECKEFALTPEYFSYRIPEIDHNFSVKLFDVLKQNDFVDANGFMRNDGRQTPWENAIEQSGLAFLNKSLYHHVQEEMNVAFGYHEMTSFPFPKILDWFESHMK